ncbi:hypothetical protein [Rhodococcus sp. MALMAid1271]|uniref:hypothetical protein n=1 Tax=Rhodococcus sp. MALMAid1271 TaxID=3411744 RepID=UPI003BA3BA97
MFAALVIAGILGGTVLDVPWAGIAGWGLALVAAVAWLLVAVLLPPSKRRD